MGKVELRKVRVEIAEIATRAMEIASPALERKSQELTVEIPSRGLAVDGDPDRLAQVFSNLLTNAAKYSDANTRIVFSARVEATRVVVRVKDEGDGIEPSMLTSIFVLFTQQRQSSERSQDGLELGLAIVKNLVAGSQFVVDLTPSTLVDAPSIEMRTPTQPGIRLGRSTKRILVVDDNDDGVELLSLALIKRGHVVSTAHDGPSALRVVENFRPNVALLEIGLPVMDGYALGKRLRETFGTALCLVAVTGYGHASGPTTLGGRRLRSGTWSSPS